MVVKSSWCCSIFFLQVTSTKEGTGGGVAGSRVEAYDQTFGVEPLQSWRIVTGLALNFLENSGKSHGVSNESHGVSVESHGVSVESRGVSGICHRVFRHRHKSGFNVWKLRVCIYLYWIYVIFLTFRKIVKFYPLLYLYFSSTLLLPCLYHTATLHLPYIYRNNPKMQAN